MIRFNRNHFFFLALFSFSLLGCPGKFETKPAPPPGSFVFGGEGVEAGSHLLELPDGSILILGSAKLPGNDDYDVQIVKVNPNGTEAWTRNYRNKDREESGHSIIATSNGYLVVGFSRKSLNPGYKLLLMELDANFDLIKKREISSATFSTRKNSVVGFFNLPNGGYLCAISMEGVSFLIGISQDLNLENQRAFNSQRTSGKANFITQTKSGEFYIALSFEDSIGFAPRFGKLDANGVLLWTSRLDSVVQADAFSLFPLGISELNNGNLIVSLYSDFAEQVLLELDTAGALVNTTTLASNPQYPFLRGQLDGSIALAGYDEYFWGNSDPHQNFSLSRQDTAENISFTENFGGDSKEVLKDMIILQDGRYALVGNTQSFGKGDSDIFLVLYNR
ncbi:MAG TPA: hypothetical protein ENJ82_17595 [Bacteroidetes bacterium]|nr:hypothetical protein [Bacteroidota bacterium]